jgi:hypothetical protein
MSDANAEKARLVGLLDDARAHTRAVLDGVDGERDVYSDTGWRVKDVIGHILVWEEEAVKAALARQKGESYVIPDFSGFDEYNRRDYEQRRDQPFERLCAALESVRDELKDAINALSVEQMEGQMVFPWWLSGTVSQLIEIMALHEREHADQIARAVT